MREYLTLHTSVFPSYLTIEYGRMSNMCVTGMILRIVSKMVWINL